MKRPKQGPITGWEPGMKMLTLNELSSITRPGQRLPPAEPVVLDRFQREQDGVEIWAIWANGTQLWCATHRQLAPKV